MTIFNFLPGYKTYIVGAGMILTGLAPLLTTGDPAAIDWTLVLEGLGLSTLRKGLSNG